MGDSRLAGLETFEKQHQCEGCCVASELGDVEEAGKKCEARRDNEDDLFGDGANKTS